MTKGKNANAGWPPPVKEAELRSQIDYDPMIFKDHVKFFHDIGRKLRSLSEELMEATPELEMVDHCNSVLSEIKVLVDEAHKEWEDNFQKTIDSLYKSRIDRAMNDK